MSSLAAARADNFYNPPDWDPSKVSRDKYQGSKGSNQYEQRGEIRFEMPWNVWCTTCDSHIGRGVRYNAKKTHITHYFSTKIWEFSMKCHLCKGIIRIQTDPQNCDYSIVAGAKRCAVTYSSSDLELRDVRNEAHKEKMERDPIYRLENEQMDRRKKLENALRIENLQTLQEREKNDYDNNCNLRKKFRTKKRKYQQLQRMADDKGLSINLLEFNDTDQTIASNIEFKAKTHNKMSPQKQIKMKRRKLANESIFDSQNDMHTSKPLRVHNGDGTHKHRSNDLSLHTTHNRRTKKTNSTLHNKIRAKEEKKMALLKRMKRMNSQTQSKAFSVNLKNISFFPQK